ncbi:MAG: GNAT family N-acetyltransferase [Clostridiales bacterium]|nr:GNAT family N-acetyltransferase [Clostridiales bacterium]
MEITKASSDDLKEILELQHLAYITEAERFGNMNIQPLTETLDELFEEFDKGTVLKMVTDDGRIIGSVRGYTDGYTLYIGKLMVHQDYRRQGLGSRLVTALEDMYPGLRYELFTSTRSIENIRMYEKLGYSVFDERPVDDELVFVYLEKNTGK